MAKQKEIKIWAITIDEQEPGMGPFVMEGLIGDKSYAFIANEKKDLIDLIKRSYVPPDEADENSYREGLIKDIKEVTVSW